MTKNWSVSCENIVSILFLDLFETAHIRLECPYRLNQKDWKPTFIPFARVVWTTTAFTLTGLLVDEGYSLNIPRGSEVEATTTYLKGRIYNAGTFNCTDFDGYLGGASTDANNVIVGG